MMVWYGEVMQAQTKALQVWKNVQGVSMDEGP
jgi:hypothetical protein